MVAKHPLMVSGATGEEMELTEWARKGSLCKGSSIISKQFFKNFTIAVSAELHLPFLDNVEPRIYQAPLDSMPSNP